jgi:hypothetical protein
LPGHSYISNWKDDTQSPLQLLFDKFLMNWIKTSAWVFVCGAVSGSSIAVWSIGVRASIPQLEPQYAQYEDFKLSPGFTPDPQTGSGTSGGSENSPNCGEIDSEPDHFLELAGNFEFLRISVSAPGDVTLLLEKPNGEQVCADDANGGILPDVSGTYPAGMYKIWVGDWGNSYDYEIRITQQAST